MKTLVIVPCYNEAQRLHPDQYIRFADLNPGIEFLFVNDGSTDDTLALLQHLAERHPVLHYLDIQPNGGKGEAVRKAMLHASQNFNATYVAFWDADLAIPLDELPRFVCRIDEGYDIVTALRLRRLGANIDRSLSRHLLSRSFATCASAALDLPVYDTQCGAKLFRAELIPVLFNEPFLSRWLFDIEILFRYKNAFGRSSACQRIFEQPLSRLNETIGSRIKPRDFLKGPIELLRIKRHYAKPQTH